MSLLQPQKIGGGTQAQGKEEGRKGKGSIHWHENENKLKMEKQWVIQKRMRKRKGTEERGKGRQKENPIAEVQKRKPFSDREEDVCCS